MRTTETAIEIALAEIRKACTCNECKRPIHIGQYYTMDRQRNRYHKACDSGTKRESV